MNANELADKLQELDSKLHLIELFKSATMLRQQQAEIEALKTDNLKYKEWSEYTEKKADEFYDEIEALKDFAIWMTGCGYDFCQHDYFIKCRDELLKGKKP